MENKKLKELTSNRSEEVQDLLSGIPNRILLWGTGSIIIIILLLLILGFLVKFPDTVTGAVRLTTTIEPSLIYSTSEGYLEKVYAKEGLAVKKGDVLAEIRNVVQSDQIEMLDLTIKEIRKLTKGEILRITMQGKDDVILGN